MSDNVVKFKLIYTAGYQEHSCRRARRRETSASGLRSVIQGVAAVFRLPTNAYIFDFHQYYELKILCVPF